MIPDPDSATVVCPHNSENWQFWKNHIPHSTIGATPILRWDPLAKRLGVLFLFGTFDTVSIINLLAGRITSTSWPAKAMYPISHDLMTVKFLYENFAEC